MRSSIAAAGLPIMAMPPRPAAGAAEEGEPAALSVAWRDEEKDEEQQQMEEGPAWLALDRSASPREFLVRTYMCAGGAQSL